MPRKGQHKIERELTKTKRDQLVVDLVTGATSQYAVSKEIGISDTSIRRWFATVPEDEKLLLVAQAKQRAAVAEKRAAADFIISDGDDIDKDLRWLLQRLRKAIEGCEDDDKLLELAQMREMRNTLMDLAKVRGMFNQKIDVQIDLGSSPQFLMLRQIMLKVLEAHPDAKADFMGEMRTLNVIDAKGIEQ